MAEKEQKCHEVSKKLENMNEKMEDRKGEVEKTEKKLKEVQETLKLTLRYTNLCVLLVLGELGCCYSGGGRESNQRPELREVAH